MQHLHDEERPGSPVAREALYLSPAGDLTVDDESLGPGFSSSRGLSIMRKWLHLVGGCTWLVEYPIVTIGGASEGIACGLGR